jgi:hypothetical protein
MVHIALPEQPPPPKWTGCVGERKGERCRGKVVTDQPFRMCDYHYDTSGFEQYQQWRWKKLPELAELVADVEERRRAESYKQAEAELAAVGLHYTEGMGWVGETDDPVVYFIRSAGYVKIGATKNVVRRMAELLVPDPELLATEPGYFARETELHRHFKNLRFRGEWFHLKDELRAYINLLRAHAGEGPVPD